MEGCLGKAGKTGHQPERLFTRAVIKFSMFARGINNSSVININQVIIFFYIFTHEIFSDRIEMKEFCNYL